MVIRQLVPVFQFFWHLLGRLESFYRLEAVDDLLRRRLRFLFCGRQNRLVGRPGIAYGRSIRTAGCSMVNN
jgi:hypothetical protein